VLDWDDTCLASSYLASHGYCLDAVFTRKPEVEEQLRELEQSVIQLLHLTLSYGPVQIITNAETGWVQLSAQKFIPAVVPWLSKLSIISARSTYEGAYPKEPFRWKYCAFYDNLHSLFADRPHAPKNVISFGDSHVERQAVRSVTRGMSNVKTKSIKFAERPTMEQLLRQLELVRSCFSFIHNYESDIDLQLMVTPTGQTERAPQSEQTARKMLAQAIRMSAPLPANPLEDEFELPEGCATGVGQSTMPKCRAEDDSKRVDGQPPMDVTAEC